MKNEDTVDLELGRGKPESSNDGENHTVDQNDLHPHIIMYLVNEY